MKRSKNEITTRYKADEKINCDQKADESIQNCIVDYKVEENSHGPLSSSPKENNTPVNIYFEDLIDISRISCTGKSKYQENLISKDNCLENIASTEGIDQVKAATENINRSYNVKELNYQKGLNLKNICQIEGTNVSQGYVLKQQLNINHQSLAIPNNKFTLNNKDQIFDINIKQLTEPYSVLPKGKISCSTERNNFLPPILKDQSSINHTKHVPFEASVPEKPSTVSKKRRKLSKKANFKKKMLVSKAKSEKAECFLLENNKENIQTGEQISFNISLDINKHKLSSNSNKSRPRLFVLNKLESNSKAKPGISKAETFENSKKNENQPPNVQSDEIEIPASTSKDSPDNHQSKLNLMSNESANKFKSEMENQKRKKVKLFKEAEPSHKLPRRSNRTKIPPLASWRNEYRVFRWKNDEMISVEYIAGTPADTTVINSILRKRERYEKSKRDTAKKSLGK